MTKTVINADPVILYVLMRTDLPDYQAGKSMAQSNHAGTMFMKDIDLVHNDADETNHDFAQWIAEANGFGTCAVLGCTLRELHHYTSIARAMGALTGVVHDPTYPIRDGHMIQTLPVDTCGYIFGRKSFVGVLVERLGLFREKE